jgi:hypothetical protein
MRVREAEGIFKIEVPDNVRKIVIVKAQIHGVMTYITPPFLQFFSYTSQHNFGKTKIYFRFRHSTRPLSCRDKIRAAHFPANV